MTVRHDLRADRGAACVATCDIDAETVAVVNVDTVEDVDASLLRRGATDFDGEDEAARLARRMRSWTPNVSFTRRDGA